MTALKKKRRKFAALFCLLQKFVGERFKLRIIFIFSFRVHPFCSCFLAHKIIERIVSLLTKISISVSRAFGHFAND